ncbi:MAG: hypothetical protein IJM91_05065 [Lachnospiraceae bacterium]|nr:hypothetical protein [Lachnospiraceae bacterium]
MKNKVLTIVFLILVFGIALLQIVIPDKVYSKSEKRMLSKLSEFSFENFYSGKFTSSVEDYISDQFVGRDGFVTAKTMMSILMQKKDSGGVYFAKDGYLIEIHKNVKESQYKKNLAHIEEFAKKMKELRQDRRVTLLPVPSASWTLRDKLPRFAANVNQKALIDLAKEYDIDVLDITDALYDKKNEYIYYKTDHHWTSYGAYLGYVEYMKHVGKKPRSLSDFTKETLCTNFRGTTYSKVNLFFAPFDEIDAYYMDLFYKVSYNSDTYVTDSIYERSYLEGKDQYAVFLNSNQELTHIEGNGTGSILILKDSYANCFAQFLPEEYKDIYLIDLRFYTGSVEEFVEENDIDEILFLYNVPNLAEDKNVIRCTK